MGWCTYSIGADRFGRVFYKNKNFYRVVMHGDWMSVLHKIIDDKKYMEKIFNAGLVRFDYLGEFLNFSQVLKLDSVYSFSYMKHRVKQQNIDALKMLCQLSLVLYDKDLTTCNFHEGDVNLTGTYSPSIDGTNTCIPLSLIFIPLVENVTCYICEL